MDHRNIVLLNAALAVAKSGFETIVIDAQGSFNAADTQAGVEACASTAWKAISLIDETVARADELMDEPPKQSDLVGVVVGALEEYRAAMEGFAEAVRDHTGTPFPWEAQDIALAKVDAALARAMEEG
ncbi:MAG: hypothetical protein JKY94_01075 [Rhodobacteraceae bacterium]|nr:hypothetical protein [Paracoccaceae bacterium]